MIEIDNICKTFKLYERPSLRLKEIILRRQFHKKYQALNKVSFSLDQGSTLGIIGENGSGKSTLLKIITGVLLPDSGKCRVQGRVTGLLELGTGFNPEFSGIQNIFFNGSYLGLSKPQIKERLEEIIAFTELEEFIQEPIKTYSSGMVMRLAFSVAMFADPQCFIVDEALSVGDAYFQQKCINRLKGFRNQGGSIVFVSHDMNAVKILCDQALLLEKGHKIEQGDPESVINTYNFLLARKTKDENFRVQRNSDNQDYGNKKIEIIAASLFDEQGNKAEVLVSGRPCCLKIQVRGREQVDNLTIGIAIRDRFGQDVFGTSTYFLNTPFCIAQNQEKEVCFSFKKFNIGPGQYTITVAGHSDESHLQDCYHWVDGAVSFEVVLDTDFFFIGLSRLEPEVKITAPQGEKN